MDIGVARRGAARDAGSDSDSDDEQQHDGVDPRTLRLHAPAVTPMATDRVPRNEDVVEARRWLEDAQAYVELMADVPREQRQPYPCRLSAADVETMVTSGIARPLDAGETPRAWCKVFAIPEWAKQRRRLLCEPRQLNEQWHRRGMPRVTLPTVLDAQLMAAQAADLGEEIVGIDAKAWYFQLGLARGVQLYYCFQHAGVTYAMTRLVMGAAISVFVGQVFMRASYNIPRALVYIDNVYLPTTDVATTTQQLTQRANELGITLSEQGATTTVLGMTFDLAERTVRVCSKFQQAHLRSLVEFRWRIEQHQPLSLRRLWRRFGVINRALLVNRAAYCFFTPAMRYLGRAARELLQHGDWRREAPTPSDDERRNIFAAANFAIFAQAVPLPDISTTPQAVVWSDASNVGGGAVIVDHLGIRTIYISDIDLRHAAAATVSWFDAALHEFNGMNHPVECTSASAFPRRAQWANIRGEPQRYAVG